MIGPIFCFIIVLKPEVDLMLKILMVTLMFLSYEWGWILINKFFKQLSDILDSKCLKSFNGFLKFLRKNLLF